MKTYLSVYFCSMLLAFVVTPLVIRLARRFGSVDVPDARKIHSESIPRIGGVAVFVSMMALTIPVLFLPNVIGDSFRDVGIRLIVLLLASSLIFALGLVDDLRGLKARHKLIVQLMAAVLVCSFGIRINVISLNELFSVNFGWFSWPLTIFWIIGVTNAVNIIDGLDGLAAGISAIACGVIAILAVYSGQPVMAVLMLALLGSLTGFLFFNFSPAKIFMGDSGSMFLGFVLASSSVMCAAKSQTLVGLALPVLALGIPIFDTLFSILRRFLERRSIFAPDRSHFHHRLLDLGLNQRHAVIVIYIVTLVFAALGMFMMATRNINTIIIFGCILLLMVLVFRVVGSVRLRHTVTGLKRKYAVTRQIREETRAFENLQLLFRRARTFDDWWQAACVSAERMDFNRLALPLKNNDDTWQTLTWQSKPDSPKVVKTKIPIRYLETGTECNLEVDVKINGSLESAGRRVTLFYRLIDEHTVVVLPLTTMHTTECYD